MCWYSNIIVLESKERNGKPYIINKTALIWCKEQKLFSRSLNDINNISREKLSQRKSNCYDD